MGYPFDQATWNVLQDVMFIGAGSSAPGIYTLIASGCCLAALWIGYKSEKAAYDNHQ